MLTTELEIDKESEIIAILLEIHKEINNIEESYNNDSQYFKKTNIKYIDNKIERQITCP